ncbi:MAG: FGGY-family carbohydrate kinase [Spirochaetaceae bacterium]|nr:FGGY-family carbohydrate kinase [Spirochaetaceae bacterium]
MILAADLGTSSLKAGLMGSDGSLKARVRVPYPHPPGLEGEVFSPLQWEQAFSEALRLLPAADITAISMSGNGPTLVALDRNGQPVSGAELWLYQHSIRIEGSKSYYLPKIEWLRRNARDIWKKTSYIISCPEYLQYRLTGRKTMTLPHESFRKYIWDKPQQDSYEIDSSLLPQMVPMGEVAGLVTEAASAEFGLNTGIPVVAAGSDFMMALLGSGAVMPGMVCDRAGTSEGINYCTEQPSGDSRLRDLPHVIEPYWNTAAILSSTGSVFEWYRRLTGQENWKYQRTLDEVEKVPPGRTAPMFFPGSRGDTLWEFGGGSFHHLEPGHGRAEMGRAVMEAIGFAVRRGIELLEESNLSVTEMRVTGGQARGRVWNQMKADITGKRLLIPETEDAELAGCACCAAAALGRFDSPVEAVETYVRIRSVIEPDPSNVSLYNDAYLGYRESAEELLKH